MPRKPVKKKNKSPVKKKHVPARKPVPAKKPGLPLAVPEGATVEKRSTPKPDQTGGKKDQQPKQFMITQRKNLLAMLDGAPTNALKELHGQILRPGEGWKHGVAELGDKLREIMIKRKFDHEDPTQRTI